jgi:hypothetical protein
MADFSEKRIDRSEVSVSFISERVVRIAQSSFSTSILLSGSSSFISSNWVVLSSNIDGKPDSSSNYSTSSIGTTLFFLPTLLTKAVNCRNGLLLFFLNLVYISPSFPIYVSLATMVARRYKVAIAFFVEVIFSFCEPLLLF